MERQPLRATREARREQDDFVFGVTRLASHRPTLVILAMRLLGTCASLDNMWTRTVSAMAQDEAHLVAALMNPIYSAHARAEMIRSAAIVYWGSEDHPKVKEVATLLRKTADVGKQRNKFAHWVWVYSKSKPECIGTLAPSQATDEGLTWMRYGREFQALNRRIANARTKPAYRRARSALNRWIMKGKPIVNLAKSHTEFHHRNTIRTYIKKALAVQESVIALADSIIEHRRRRAR